MPNKKKLEKAIDADKYNTKRTIQDNKYFSADALEYAIRAQKIKQRCITSVKNIICATSMPCEIGEGVAFEYIRNLDVVSIPIEGPVHFVLPERVTEDIGTAGMLIKVMTVGWKYQIYELTHVEKLHQYMWMRVQ